MKLVYLTAGAGGMYCGSCLSDNAVAKALPEFGWDVQLVPCYTPIRTDESDTSIDQVFFGGINVWLQQKIPLFRWLPQFIDRFLDNPRLIRRVTSRAVETDARFLDKMAVSMLRGTNGNQRKEVHRLVKWLVREAQPDVIMISNILIAAFVLELKRLANIPVVVMLQGDDVFLKQLSEPALRDCLAEVSRISEQVDLFLTHSEDYRQNISDFLNLDPSRIVVSPLGLDTSDYQKPAPASDSGADSSIPVLGYLARLAPEKGLHRIVNAFIALKKMPAHADLRLHIAGWLSPEQSGYAEQQWDRLRAAGLADDFRYEGVVNRQEKLEFLRRLTVFSVPTVQREPKGLFVLEALASGVPVVLPNHGAFPEVLAETGGGVLFENDNPDDYVRRLDELLSAPSRADLVGAEGKAAVLNKRSTKNAAQSLDRILNDLLKKYRLD